MACAPKASGYLWSNFRAGCAVPGVGYLEIDVDIPSGGYRWALYPPKSDRIIEEGLAENEADAKAAAERAANKLQLRPMAAEAGHVYSA